MCNGFLVRKSPSTFFNPFMPQLILKRIVIYAKDIENITGRKEKAARQLMKKMRNHFGKKPGSMITVREFCKYTGLSVEEVTAFLVS
jgi:hypothetical protein